MKLCEYKSFRTRHDLRNFVNENPFIEVLSIIGEGGGYLLFYKK